VARLRKRADVDPEPVAAPEPEPVAVQQDELEPVDTPELSALGAEPSEEREEAERGSGTYESLYATGLTKVLAIAGREVGGLLVSPIGWVITPIVILVVSYFGYLIPLLGSQQATMESIFGLIAFLLILPIVPLSTMRVLAEERRQGTLEMLLTSPVRDWELVVGKWLGSLAFFGAMFSFTLVYVALFLIYLPKVTVKPLGIPLSIGNLDFGLLLSGYLGLLALAATFLAVGVLCSSLTQNQIVAAFLTFGALIVIYYCGQAAQFLAPPYDAFFQYVGGQERYASFSQGNIALKDVVYFASLTLGALFIATRVLESRKWR
jgi:ABC-2 type transport system permease protein